MTTPSISIVIPNYNDALTLAACVRGVYEYTRHPCWQLIVVDDGSTDGSLDVLREFKNVRVIKKTRGGVASALNAGFAASPGMDVVRLHADVVIETPDWLDRLIEAAQQPKAAVVGARLVYPDGRIQSEGRAIITGLGFHPQHKNLRAFQSETVEGKVQEVDSIAGGLAYYRRDALDRVGGLDENYGPAWLEDDDYCVAARRLGYKVYVQPAVRAVHYARAHAPNFQIMEPGIEGLLASFLSQYKSAIERMQALYWEKKWGWHPFYPDLNEIRRLYGDTELCWRIGESLRFRAVEEFPAVDCCIVTWNTLPLLRRCLESLARTDYPAEKIQVHIADNASTDGTSEYLGQLAATYPFRLHHLRLPVNTGCPAGLNAAIVAGESQLVARLDDDIILPPNWLKIMVADLARRPFSGCVAAKTINDDDRHAIQWGCPHCHPTGYNHPDEPDDGHADYLARVSNIHGCCILYRRDVFQRCGLVDIRYSPSQHDDLDHNIALIQGGYEVLYDGRVSVIHKLNNGLDRSAAALANGRANANKFFGKWGKDVLEVIDTAILLSREGRYLPDDGNTSASLDQAPDSRDFPRAGESLQAGYRGLIWKVYDELAAPVAPGSQLHRLNEDYLIMARDRLAANITREALDIALSAVDFAPLCPENYVVLAAVFRSLGLCSLACAAARRGLHICPVNATLRAFAATTPDDIAAGVQNTIAGRRARAAVAGAAHGALRVLMVNTFQPRDADEDIRQMEKLRHYLVQEGLAVDIAQGPRPDPRGYDIIHAWNVNPAFAHQILSQLKAIRLMAPGLPVVLTPCYTDFREVAWSRGQHTPVFAKPNFTPQQIDQALQQALRSRPDLRTKPPLCPVPKPFDQIPARLVALADHILPASRREWQMLAEHLDAGRPHTIVPASADPDLAAAATADWFVQHHGLRDFILTVGPLDPEHNQLMLLHALRATHLPIVVVGPRRDVLYARFCAEHASRHCRFIEHLSDEQLASAYRAAKVTVLPGWIDTAATPWLEAALAGCALAVSNRLNANESLGSCACAFDPADPAAIRKAVLQACSHHKSDAIKRAELAGQLRTHNTCTEAARLVISAYQAALATSSSGRHAARPPARLGPGVWGLGSGESSPEPRPGIQSPIRRGEGPPAIGIPAIA